MTAKARLCSKCSGPFHEGDKIQFTGLSVYHEVPIPHGQELQFAIERPSLVTNVEHLVCNE